MKPYTDITDSQLVKAMAHPLRVQILGLLDQRSASPSEIAEQLGASLGLVSYHVRRLAALGVIELVSTTPVRGALEHHYRAKERPRLSVDGWDQVPAVVKRRLVGDTVRDIGASVSAAANDGGFDHNDAVAVQAPLVLDDRGWEDVGREVATLLTKVRRIEAASAKRLAGQDAPPARDAALACLMFAPAPRAPRRARRSRRARG